MKTQCMHCVKPACATGVPHPRARQAAGTARSPGTATSASAAATAWWPARSTCRSSSTTAANPKIQKCKLCFERCRRASSRRAWRVRRRRPELRQARATCSSRPRASHLSESRQVRAPHLRRAGGRRHDLALHLAGARSRSSGSARSRHDAVPETHAQFPDRGAAGARRRGRPRCSASRDGHRRRATKTRCAADQPSTAGGAHRDGRHHVASPAPDIAGRSS